MPATRIEVFDEVDSTQDVARDALGADPVLVVARTQHRGRGRSGAPWETAPRAVAASLGWGPGWPTEHLPVLTLVAGLAATDVVDARLAWPNDLVVGDLKVGGILAEAADGQVVVGLGLNLWWPDPPEGIGALHGTDPGPDASVDVATAWAERLRTRAADGPEAWDRDTYLRRCATIGTEVVWDPDGAGHAVDVAQDGGLVVETDSGRTTIRSGAVRRVRPRDG